MNINKQVDTRIRYSAKPNHRDIVAAICINELNALLNFVQQSIDSEDVEYGTEDVQFIYTLMHKIYPNINSLQPMRLLSICSMLSKWHNCCIVRIKKPLLIPNSILLEDNEGSLLLQDDNGGMLLERPKF